MFKTGIAKPKDFDFSKVLKNINKPLEGKERRATLVVRGHETV